MKYLVLLAVLVGCVDDAAGPSEDELAALDDWAGAADGKADLPNTYGEAVAWVKDIYTNKMSAIWKNQEHPATAAAALARIRQLIGADPTAMKFVTTVQRLHADLIDHSEIDIQLAPGKVIRLVGDPKGAGAFVDTKVFETSLSPALCLTWSELTTAVETAYQPGHYALDFVCHTVTEKVLRALDIGTKLFSSQIRTYNTARFVWGPILPSFDSNTPGAWAESRSCGK